LSGRDWAGELTALTTEVVAELDAAHRAREAALAACRLAIQSSSRSIRAAHRGELAQAGELAAEARARLDEAREALSEHPAIAAAGFLHDAEKEYAEAVLFGAMVAGSPLEAHANLGVRGPAWLCGLAEAASELRRHVLDCLRGGALERAEEVLGAMDEVYGALIGVDFPDAVTGGLRRTTDALRGVLERTRGDLTTTVLQARLQATIAEGLGDSAG